jgi:hypothetical protein
MRLLSEHGVRLHGAAPRLIAALCLAAALAMGPGPAFAASEGAAQLLLAESGAEAGMLSDLRSRYDQGLIGKSDYESAQLRALSTVTPARDGLIEGLRKLRDLWQRGLITELPYYLKRQEFLDAL